MCVIYEYEQSDVWLVTELNYFDMSTKYNQSSINPNTCVKNNARG